MVTKLSKTTVKKKGLTGKKTSMKNTVFSFRPDPDVRTLLERAADRKRGVTRSRFINDALREKFASLARKKELSQGE